ncbi:hypothetical protein A2738_02470 [Candidatus Nomurabacteria bacterium RIFCSPHIGHO2_01_FULL_42_15]|uniref:Uncharacterized protein n=1 Tax=Candidatus Nomurabacteria bacterium RIFCSPHIGHO2_01_FULL_42_15 TaxID=1801742 RepID=A0A1F6VFF5_9BACT|nr:MAG: hypothetical protein A2738_02470 [Candidatus Nomurabacteria bacterium RIFCSPHIGHO2_01_FULL_42_15]OGI93460.1 MAG: hypothetical protein A3A99_02200 [Candidatus Nomurabacteria bacterium RIFCSPLOWO2_01_FULL_41_18]
MTSQNDWKKYIIVFFITLTLFASAFYITDYFYNNKINQLKSIQDNISIDILSSETQFSLLQELSCKDVDNSVLSQEINNIADKINYSEKNFATDNTDIRYLKKYYSLLEIKDYLLMKKISERCGTKNSFILYMYSPDPTCTDCVKQEFVLSALREKYPQLRIYSFDYDLDLSAIKALISIYKIPSNVPVMVIDGKNYQGFKTIEEIETIIPQLKDFLVEEGEENTKPAEKPAR